MSDKSNSFLSTQTIKDNSGTDLNFVNKIIFYNDDYNFLSTRLFVKGEWKKQLFEYDYNDKEMLNNINISNPSISAVVHPSITVPTVMIEGFQYTMFTYYIAKTAMQDFSKTNYCWYSCESIIDFVKKDDFTSNSINNLRRFFELLSENKSNA